MNDIFRPHLRQYVLIFFDDILVYNRTWEEHLGHLRTVLDLLRQHKLKAKDSKCLWGQQRVDNLGHIIYKDGVEADPNKIQSMVDWSLPKTTKELRGFLGLIGYYRRFIVNYGKVVAPLTALLRKGAFSWMDKAREEFEALKKAMISASVLGLAAFTKSFTSLCDASGVDVGALLMQEDRPVAYMSKALSKRSQLLSTYEREILAIIHAITKGDAS
ncbi:uncharacterized mitochondrial protein AtMg00860-like [Typha latifolia]|uniref:uncharacterized mitochondrial protein AtMg00860-like n=1 Tax=Typha latifolia TaxID=4733 RepID=UPI003C2D8392